MNNISLNTHAYDGKLGQWISKIQGKLDEAGSISEIEKKRVFEVLHLRLKEYPEFDTAAERCFKAVNGCTPLHGSGNYDNKNNLYADDLLYICAMLVLSDDNEVVTDAREGMLGVLCMQFHDMATGLCPQGRTTRLLQAYVMITG